MAERTPHPITAYALSCGLGRTTDEVFQALRDKRRGLREVPFEIPFEAITGTVPGGPLPPTAPGSRLEQQAPLTMGLVASLCLLLVAPLLLAFPGGPPRAPRDTEDLKLALSAKAPPPQTREGPTHSPPPPPPTRAVAALD